MRLFIVGNGFDLNLKIKTSGNDYISFLEENYSDVGGQIVDFKGFVQSSKERNGNEIEQMVLIDYEEMIDDEACYLPDLSSDHPGGGDFQYEINKELEGAGMFFNDCLNDGIANIDNGIKNNKMKIINPFKNNDLFVTFNYTSTLEEWFGISDSNILHIHGYSGCAQFGYYSESETPEKVRAELEIKYRNYDLSDYSDGIDIICDYLQTAQKKVHENFDDLNNFLSNKSIDEIIILGHSLSITDDAYFRDILIPKFKKMKGIFYFHNPIDEENKRSFVLKYGLEKVEYRNWDRWIGELKADF